MRQYNLLIYLVKILWLLSCFYIGISYFKGGEFTGESSVSFIMFISLLTFPIGYLGIYMLTGFIWLLSIVVSYEASSPLIFSIVLWFLMVGLGYIQWFCLIPKLVNKTKILINATYPGTQPDRPPIVVVV